MIKKRDKVQPRRWAYVKNKPKNAWMTENALTPEEVYSAIAGTLVQVGLSLENIDGYDPDKDVFYGTGISANNERTDWAFPGETIAKVVKTLRTLCRLPKMIRPSDIPATQEGYQILQDMINATGEH
jgi:hypothetical protein